MKNKRSKKFLKSGMVAAPDCKFTGQEPTWHNCPKEKYDDKFSKCLKGAKFFNFFFE